MDDSRLLGWGMDASPALTSTLLLRPPDDCDNNNTNNGSHLWNITE